MRKFIGSENWARVRDMMGRFFDWRLRPPHRPAVNREFSRLPLFSRAVESLRYNLAWCEYWVSPGGVAREFMHKLLGLAAIAGPVWLAAWVLSCLVLKISSLFSQLLLGGILLLAVVLLVKFLPRLFRYIWKS